jgi:hypothetical protein
MSAAPFPTDRPRVLERTSIEAAQEALEALGVALDELPEGADFDHEAMVEAFDTLTADFATSASEAMSKGEDARPALLLAVESMLLGAKSILDGEERRRSKIAEHLGETVVAVVEAGAICKMTTDQLVRLLSPLGFELSRDLIERGRMMATRGIRNGETLQMRSARKRAR